MLTVFLTISLQTNSVQVFASENQSILIIGMTIIILLFSITIGHLVFSNKRRITDIEALLSNQIEEIRLIVHIQPDEEQADSLILIDSTTHKDIIAPTRASSANHETSTGRQVKPQDTVYKDHELFQKLHNIIMSRKLYLNPELARNDLQTILHIGKNRLIEMIKNEGYSSITTYINTLRIEYAIKLMKEHPNHTVRSIAEDCGIPNVRTFHRVFLEITGNTPRNTNFN